MPGPGTTGIRAVVTPCPLPLLLCTRHPQLQLTPPQPHAQRAGFFATRCWGATHAPRRMAAASRSTAIAQREEECRGSANGHPGVRAGDTPLTRLARHAGYGGGDSVERGGASSFVTLDVRLHTSRSAVNIARLSFPRDYPAGTSPSRYPNGQYIR